MDARLTEEHQQIQETARDFLESNDGIEFARQKMEGDDEVVEEVWSEISQMDYTALTIPFDYGGLGEGMVYLSALLEELGRYAMPGPYPETMAFCVPLIDDLGNDEQKTEYFEAVADEGRKMSFALYDDRNEEVPEAIQLDADRVEDGFELNGTKTLVPYGGEVERLVVAARTQDATEYQGISTFLVDPSDPAVDAHKLESLDRTRPMYELTFDELVVDEDELLGPVHGGGEALARAIDRFTVAMCAWLVGGADRAVEESTEWGNERHQYGQPIGRFQAVKHRIAEMWMDTEHARSLTYYAAWALDTDASDAGRAVSTAKAFAGERLPRVFSDDIWNHGGQGFTWDYDAHIYLKQAKAWQNYLGSPEYHLDRVADTRGYATRTLPDYPTLTVPPYQ